MPDPARTGCAQAGMTNSAKKIIKKKGQASGRKVWTSKRQKKTLLGADIESVGTGREYIERLKIAVV